MELRPATPDDALAIRQVARASWHAAYDGIIGAEEVDAVVDDWYAVDDLAASIAAEEAATVLAEADGEVVGFAQGGPSDDGPADGHIPRIYVHPSRWGEGIGSALLGRLHDALAAAGCDDVWLVVLADNEVGRGFYASKGYGLADRQETDIAGVSVEELVLVADL